MRRTLLRIVLPLLVSVAAAATHLRPHPDNISIVGLWELQMLVDSSTIYGALSLTPAEARLAPLWVSLSDPTHIGIYHLRDGRGLAAERIQPIAGARTREGNRVTIVLAPGVSHGSIIMEGTVVGDSIFGTWAENAYAEGKSGKFRLLRVTRRAEVARLGSRLSEVRMP